MVRAIALVLCLAVVACGGAASAPGTPSPSAAEGSASRQAGAGSRIEGTVQRATASAVMLSNGTTLAIAATTRVIRIDPATAGDLRAGLFVAITAKAQPDNSLLASMVSIFSESLGRSVPAGQRPLPEGNLMTNAAIAAIDQVTGTSFTVTLPGGTTNVRLAPGAVLLKQIDVRPEDLRAGTRISATIVNGTAQSIQIQSQ